MAPVKRKLSMIFSRQHQEVGASSTPSPIGPVPQSAPTHHEPVPRAPTNGSSSLASSSSNTSSPPNASNDGKKTRGKTMMKEICTLQEGKRIPIEVNSVPQPVGDGASLLTNYLGTLVRCNALIPFRAKSWPKVDQRCKDNLLSLLKKKFEYDPILDSFLLESAGVKLREHRCDMKRDFFEKDMQPTEIPDYDWNIWVERWNSADMKMKSQKAKESCKSKLTHHRNGSKSFAKERHEYVKENGVEPGPVEFFNITHLKKDKTLDPVTANIVDTVKSRVAEIVRDSTNIEQVHAAEEECLNDALGKERPGRVRNYGLGVTRSKLNRSKASSSSQSDERVKRLEAQVDLYKQFTLLMWKQLNPNEPDPIIDELLPPVGRQVPDANSMPTCNNSSGGSNPSNNEN